MSPMEMNKPQGRVEQIVFVLGKVIFLPHYQLPMTFVAPGHTKLVPRTFRENQLKMLGAKRVVMKLWPRDYE